MSEIRVSGETVAIRGQARRHRNAWWTLALTATVVVTGMAYSLWWVPVVRHGPNGWLLPGDLLGTVRMSTYIGNGYVSYLYSLQTSLVTLPGFAIVFMPFVKLCAFLHLVPATTSVPLLRPSEWLLIGPVSMATSGVALAGLDALARVLDTSLARRRILLVLEAAAIWPVVAIWGHPEDVLALGFGALALSRALQGRTVSAGWLLGAALAMQLYAVLLVPILVGLLGVRRSADLLGRAAVLPGALFLAMLIPNAHGTLHALLDQPNFPTVDYPTPWVLVAPHIGHDVVAAGPGRIVGLLGACGLGFLAARRRDDTVAIVWLAAGALALRCLTEAVMDPYYVAPAIALALVAVAPRAPWRAALTVAAGAALTVLTYDRPGMWWYWLEMAGTFAVLLAPAWRSRSSARAEEATATATSTTTDDLALALVVPGSTATVPSLANVTAGATGVGPPP